MQIKIMTCQHVYNYGATLQAYALQTYLESLGHCVEIIDYRLPTHVKYELFTLYPEGRLYSFLRKYHFLAYLYAPIRNRKMFYTWGRKNAFDSFDAAYLHLTNKTYRTIDELKDNHLVADVFIAGSDQIWNPEYPNGTDKGYYLDFGDPKIMRISYAASFGVQTISVQQQAFVKEQLKRFDYISVRESSGIEILRNMGIKAELCVDPVFLLNKDEWCEYLSLKENVRNYIMLYDFTHDDEKIKSFSLDLKKRTGLKLLAVNDYSRTPYADIQVNNASPKDFLEFIINAKYVVCNSFHATVFSIIFHKKVASFPLRQQNNSSRITDILRALGLTDFFMPNLEHFMEYKTDWTKTDGKLKEHIVSSKTFLKKVLHEKD